MPLPNILATDGKATGPTTIPKTRMRYPPASARLLTPVVAGERQHDLLAVSVNVAEDPQQGVPVAPDGLLSPLVGHGDVGVAQNRPVVLPDEQLEDAIGAMPQPLGRRLSRKRKLADASPLRSRPALSRRSSRGLDGSALRRYEHRAAAGQCVRN